MGYYLFSYACTLVFLTAVIYRICRLSSLPMHLRWEVYPVQHESPSKSSYGGSYMEAPDWWEKNQERSLFNELKYMTVEILFIRTLMKENKPLWMVSFPFHFGLYLIIATFALLLLYAIFTLCETGGMLMTILNFLIIIIAWTGMLLGAVGGIGMLHRRISDPELRSYSSFMDYFNICIILIFFLSALFSSISNDPLLEGAKSYIFGLLTGGRSLNGYAPGNGMAGSAAILSASFLAAYIPITHMSHMFMKYFLYHRVKWDDAPNLRGNRIEAEVKKNLEFKPTWSAKHVDADGNKNWLDIASSGPKETS